MEWVIGIALVVVIGYLGYWVTYEIRSYRELNKITKKIWKSRCKYCGKTIERDDLPEYCGPDCYLSYQLERRR